MFYRIIIITLFIFPLSAWSNNNPNSILEISVALANEQVMPFKHRGVTAEADGILAINIQYNLSEKYGIEFSRSQLDNCFGLCYSEYELVDESVLATNNYKADVYKIGGVFRYPYSKNVILSASPGILVLDESIETKSCHEFSSSFLGLTCNNDASRTELRSNQSEVGGYLQLAASYTLSNHWSVSAFMTRGFVHKGYTQNGFRVGFRF